MKKSYYHLKMMRTKCLDLPVRIFTFLMLFSIPGITGFAMMPGINTLENYTESAVQQSSVSGTVKDVNGEVLPGVTVRLKGTDIGVATDMNGKYSINVDNLQDAVLIFSFVGMETKEVPVNGLTSVDVILQETSLGIDEVVVVGYGSQRKVNLTGAVSVIDKSNLKNVSVNNTVQALQGTTTGLTIIDAGGAPGAERVSMLIRGVGTIGNNVPLVIVDGVISSLSNLNPSDIENISVLKDAASTSIYGSRAANGVVLITTKKGEPGKTVVTYDGQFTFKDFVALPKPLPAADQARYLNQAYFYDGRSTPKFTEDEIALFESGEDPLNYPNTDWIGLALQGSGFTHSHNVSVSNGTDKLTYRLSFGLLSEEGRMKNTSFDKGTLRLNLENQINDYLTVGINSSLIFRDRREPTWAEYGSYTADWMMNWLFSLTPILPAVNEETGEYMPMWWQALNPLNHIDNGGQKTQKNLDYLQKLYASIDIIEGLNLDLSASLNGNIGKEHFFKKQLSYYGGGLDYPAFAHDMNWYGNTTTYQALLNYRQTLNDAHNIKFLAGASQESYHYEYSFVRGDEIPSNETGEIDAAATTKTVEGQGFSTDSRVRSYFSRANYDFKGKYLVEANLRYDGSSKFSEDVRWGLFPSFSAGWRMSEESFLQDVGFINNLKIRASWGRLGNSAGVGEYQYLANIIPTTGYPFGGNDPVQGMTQGGPVNALLTWETLEELDIGFDLLVFDGLFGMSFDYYNRLTYDILSTIPVPNTFGDDAPFSNDAKMSNKGVEILVTHNNTILDNLSYNISGHLTFNRNNVEKYSTPSIGNNIYEEGYEWGAYYGYEWSGYFFESMEDVANYPTQVGTPERPGDLMFVDQNSDDVIDENDRVELGTRTPGFVYGFNAGLNYRNIDLSVLFQGVGDAYKYMPWNILWPFNAESWQPIYEHQLDFWSPENLDATMPRISVQQNAHNKVFSSYTVKNASYLRLKNIELGYILPENISWKIGFDRLRIFVSARNILTFSKITKAYDPETTGTEAYSLPATKYLNFGINVTFK